MPKCDYCEMPFDICDGIYDDGDFMCGSCIEGFIIRSETSLKTEKRNKYKTVSSGDSKQVSEEQIAINLDIKAGRLANNIQIMLRKGGSLNINPSNKKAFELAVERLGMRLDEFDIGDDDYGLSISLKRKMQCRIVSAPAPALLKRPEFPNRTGHLPTSK
jgi:hypothetical protein